MKPERATVQEQVGVAVNASHLEHRLGESHIDRVGALGAAALQIHHNVDRTGQALHAVVAQPGYVPNPQDVFAAELASLLTHIREGRQHELVPRAVQTFTRWMAYRGRFDKYADAGALLPKLAARALHEFLSDRCPRCGGSGLLQVTQNGTLVRGTGRSGRNTRFQACPHKNGCGGTGKPAASHTARRIALGIDHSRYESERWDANVNAAMSWLARMQHRLKRPLTAQLDRSTKRD